jgi:ABC-type polysaccharide transport system permease subunit
MYDTTGTSKSFPPSSLIGLDRFMQLIQKDGFGDILWNELDGYAFVTIYVTDPVLIADFSQPSITETVSG